MAMGGGIGGIGGKGDLQDLTAQIDRAASELLEEVKRLAQQAQLETGDAIPALAGEQAAPLKPATAVTAGPATSEDVRSSQTGIKVDLVKEAVQKASGSALKPRSYKIQSGDTLWEIASRLKAQGVKGSHWDIIRRIQAMNPQIKDPDRIYAGDTIQLPGSVGGAGGGSGASGGASRPGGAAPAVGGGGAAAVGGADDAPRPAGQLGKKILGRARDIGGEINRTGGYRFDGRNDCYGFVRRVWDPVLEGAGKAKLPVNDVGSGKWSRIDWNKLKPGDVLSTAQGHAWGANWHGGLYAGKKDGVHYIHDNSGSKSAQLRPLPSTDYFNYYYEPTHAML